jgi:Zn-dependent peptidase ImmA (M78 family)
MSTAARTFASELVATLKLTAPVKPVEVARSLGLEVQYCNASGFDGALVCSKENHAGTILVKDSIREAGRVRFTIAHEIAHYVLPHHGVNGSICRTKDVESWDESLPEEECEANVFAGELLIPEVLLEASVSRGKPTFDMIRDLSRTFDTSLTASAYRAMGLTTFRAAIVWSTGGVIRWFKASEEFEAFVAVHDRVPEGTYAYDCFRGLSVPDDLRTVKAHLWLAPSRRRNPDYIFEHSVSLPSYDSVLTLLYIEEVATSPVDEEENLDELHPEDFTLNRRRWPR